jgi:hypothetical protein
MSIFLRTRSNTDLITFFTTGTFQDSKLVQIQIQLDMHELLAKMMVQASRIVAAVVEVTNNAFVVPEANGDLERRDSYLIMPPPMPVKPTTVKSMPVKPTAVRPMGGLELLCRAAADLPIVSPDVSALDAPSRSIPELELTADPFSGLSPDQCADIVDGVLGDFDDDFLMGPPMKKARVEG